MLKHTHELYNEALNDLVDNVNTIIDDDEASLAMKKAEILSKLQPLVLETETAPTTKLGKVKVQVARALDNETTRTVIKAGGAFAGVALVAYSTIKRDHVLERTALQQANQRSV